ncbi:hypothetical protein T08_14309 [Trichinella sp. T8]|nr:hypothetical protein T08_14309 [Trichinella sp. T8]
MWLTARLFGLRLRCTVRGIAQPSRFSNYFSMIWVTRRGVRSRKSPPQERSSSSNQRFLNILVLRAGVSTDQRLID